MRSITEKITHPGKHEGRVIPTLGSMKEGYSHPEDHGRGVYTTLRTMRGAYTGINQA